MNSVLLAVDMPVPDIEYRLLSPMLIVFGAAVLGVLAEAFAPRASRYRVQVTLGIGGLVAAGIAVALVARGGSGGYSAMAGALALDPPALFCQGALVMLGILGLLLMAERVIPHPGPGGDGLDAFTPQASAAPGSVVEKQAGAAGVMQTEVFPLTMLSIGGMMMFVAANDLLALFVALEVLSLPLYVMCGLARRRRLASQEAALKYFLLGAFSSAILLYGSALLYGYAGTLSLTGIGEAVARGDGRTPLALLGAGLLLVGLLFKVGAVPFGSWVPDVYQGAPTAVTAFMGAAVKVAAFGALLRICYVALPGMGEAWKPVLWVVAILTMAVATIAAITQNDVKRMLAYSAVSHTGFILTGVIALNDAGLSGTLFYLFAYGFSTLGAFAVVGLVRSGGAEDTALDRWAGLGRRYPVLGVVFSLFLFAFAGIPLTSGFVAKFAVFKAAGEGGALPLVVIAVIASAVAAYFYLRVIVLMFFTEAPEDPPVLARPSWSTAAVVAVTAGITFALGALPQPLLDLADASAYFLR